METLHHTHTAELPLYQQRIEIEEYSARETDARTRLVRRKISRSCALKQIVRVRNRPKVTSSSFFATLDRIGSSKWWRDEFGCEIQTIIRVCRAWLQSFLFILAVRSPYWRAV